MDKFYCLILINKTDNSNIELRFLQYDYSILFYNYPICFTASNASVMFALLFKNGILQHFSSAHLLYLGKELFKAEISFLLQQKYIQE